ncbi:MAG: sugar kinase [Saccharofermentanales bacterium]
MFQTLPKDECRFDCISLGEIMLRFDPGDKRIRSADRFDVYAGGGEYNVTYGLSSCFGLRTAVLTALADNETGKLIESFVLRGGVDPSFIRWVGFDGVGRSVRNGLNFTERGFGVRGALGVSDRGNTAASQLRSGDFDFDHIFGTLKARWFHTGGIFAALSDSTAEVVIEAMKTARKYGTIVSYDMNFRPSLWKSIGGVEKARAVNREIVRYADVLIGNEEDFTACLGLEIEGNSGDLTSLDTAGYERMIRQVCTMLPDVRLAAVTLRTVKSASVNSWGAMCGDAGQIYLSRQYSDILIYDRIGGGDSFASGLIYGILDGQDLQVSLDFGVAHGALAMTTPGDLTMASKSEVVRLASGGGARVQR